LQEQLLDGERLVNFVAGPDAYRDLPRLILAGAGAGSGPAINVQLSTEETCVHPTLPPSRLPTYGCVSSAIFAPIPPCFPPPFLAPTPPLLGSYADIAPVRRSGGGVSSFLSIMRG
jgi:hypothetical protein